jgi:sulfoxide reductase heme-binding subunit YedZ
MGKTALILLVLTLACTPASTVFGIKWMLRLRRLLGLYTFAYASLHFLSFIGLDYGFSLTLLREDLPEKYFVLVGFAAFLTLIPLAITSTRGWMRRLGKKWERLHWLIYLVALLAVTHFAMQVKIDLREPVIYGVIVVLLLVTRIPYVSELIRKMRHQFKKRRETI